MKINTVKIRKRKDVEEKARVDFKAVSARSQKNQFSRSANYLFHGKAKRSHGKAKRSRGSPAEDGDEC